LHFKWIFIFIVVVVIIINAHLIVDDMNYSHIHTRRSNRSRCYFSIQFNNYIPGRSIRNNTIHILFELNHFETNSVLYCKVEGAFQTNLLNTFFISASKSRLVREICNNDGIEIYLDHYLIPTFYLWSGIQCRWHTYYFFHTIILYFPIFHVSRYFSHLLSSCEVASHWSTVSFPMRLCFLLV